MPLNIETHDKRLQVLSRIKSLNSEKLYIWGDGTYSLVIIDYLRTVGCYKGQIVSIVDDDYYDSEKSNSVPFSQFLNIAAEKSPIIFGFYNYKIIQQKKAKWSGRFPYLYDFHLTVVNGQRLLWNPFLAKEREEAYRRTYLLLSDEKSKQVMQLYLNAATGGEFHELFATCYEEPSYFNSITKKLKINTLIDCGAYDGDSVHDFIDVFPDYSIIIAIEPDPKNYDKLLSRKKQEKIRNLSIIQKGVGSNDGYISFQVNGKSNYYLSDKGNTVIQLMKLDDIISDTIGNILIKMDIEGSEMDALLGAQNIILKKHPVLAICVYHKEEDLIQIPQFISELVGKEVYQYYLGFHGLDLSELVFYAIPNSALKD